MNPRRFHLTVLLLLSFALLGAQPELPPSTDAASPADLRARERLQKILPGRIIFDSNRENGFGIHIADAAGSISVFADTARHEMYPDVSPDGKSVVFSSEESLEEGSPAQIWIASADGSGLRQLSPDGTFPTFSADGRSVYFGRKRRLVMKHDLASGTETEIFPKRHRRWSREFVVSPRISPDGRYVAFTTRHPRRWSAWYVALDHSEGENIGPGCEPSWFPAGDKLVWISGRNAQERSGVFAFDRASKQVSVVQDIDAPRGHEYFPSISKDVRFLLYAAARPGEHDALSANYQLYVKELDTGVVTRVTFDAAVNRWPKLLPAPGSR